MSNFSEQMVLADGSGPSAEENTLDVSCFGPDMVVLCAQGVPEFAIGQDGGGVTIVSVLTGADCLALIQVLLKACKAAGVGVSHFA